LWHHLGLSLLGAEQLGSVLPAAAAPSRCCARCIRSCCESCTPVTASMLDSPRLGVRLGFGAAPRRPDSRAGMQYELTAGGFHTSCRQLDTRHETAKCTHGNRAKTVQGLPEL
jgi:hypothetical protein